MWIYYTIGGVVFFATLAMMVREGLWSNTINLLVILASGLIAFGFFEPVTVMVDEKTDGEYTYLLDIAVIYGIYSISVLVLKGFAGMLSKTRMRFRRPVDEAGGPIVGAITGCVMTCFVLATLHTAPLGKETMGGAFSYTDVDSRSSLTSPDLAWLRFVESMAMPSRLGINDGWFTAERYVATYMNHRAVFESQEDTRVKRG